MWPSWILTDDLKMCKHDQNAEQGENPLMFSDRECHECRIDKSKSIHSREACCEEVLLEPLKVLFIHKGGIGDALLAGTVAARYAENHPKHRVHICTNFPELFFGSDLRIIPLEREKLFRWSAKLMPKRYRCIDLYYSHDYENDPALKEHMLTLMARKAGLSSIDLKPLIKFELDPSPVFPEEEKIRIGIHSLGKEFPPGVKDYTPERWNEVIRLVKAADDRVSFVQLGASADPLLKGVTYNLRGMTSIQGSVSVLAQLDLFVGQVGFLMHAARAVECPAVIVFGGSEKAHQSGYSENTNIESDPECSPCWIKDCPYDIKCMSQIEPELVAAKILEQLS